MKISHFCWGLELNKAVSVLAIYGLVMSVIGAMVAAFLFFLPLILSFDFDIYGNIRIGINTGATFLLLVQLGWFAFSYMLHQKNNAEDVTGVQKMIKIGSYIIGSVQVWIFAGIILIAIGSGYNVVVGGMIALIYGIFLIFPTLLLDGIRTKNSGKVKAWVIFKCVITGKMLAACVVLMFLPEQVWQIILGLLLYAIIVLYSSCVVIIHYNILLDEENLLGSADDQKKLLDNPPAYSQVV